MVRMHTIKTVENQVPFLRESFFSTPFKGRRKSSATNILRKQQNSLLNQQHQQQPLILEYQQQHPKQLLPLSVENGQGQHTPKHQHRARSTSIPLCKTAECARADGDGKEGQNERKDQRLREAAQWRQGERGVSGSKPVAVGATLLLITESASEELGEAASFSRLPLTVVGRKQGIGSSKSAATNQEPASVASQEEAQHAQPRPQQHGLLAKGVRLLRNMGNQEAKQKKGGGNGGATGDVTCAGDGDEREVDKKFKKSNNKVSKGGGEHSGKKKSKSESKGSVFSGMKIRKSLSKAKGFSKGDMLEDERSEHFSKTGLKHAAEASLSADDMVSDVEGDLSHLSADSHQSMADEIARKTSSGSDADLYSFHSAAAENEDLLSDIQQAIRDQCMANDRLLMSVHLSERSTSKGTKGPEKVIPQQLFNQDQEVSSTPVDSECVLQEASGECKKLENENCVMSISRNSSGPGSLTDSGPPSSAPDTERSSVSLFPKTNSTYSFPDTTTTSYESAEEPQDDPDSPVLHPRQTTNTCVPRVLLDPVVAGVGPMGSHKSVSSMDLSMQREEEEEAGRRDFLSLKGRKSSLSISQLTTDHHVSQPRQTSSTSPSTVKLYPPIHPSYVKTTTRQLTSPVGSPITSPHAPRKTNTIVPSEESSGDMGFRRHKQRSCSIAGSISVSADWSNEQDTPEKSYTGGTYWTLGSRRTQYARRTSSTTPPYLDVFSGESHIAKLKVLSDRNS